MSQLDAPLFNARVCIDSCEAQVVASQGMPKHLRREALKSAQDEAAKAAQAAEDLVKALEREIYR